MPTSPFDLFTLAERMQSEVGNEAALRCAVSRSYYAALMLADSVFPERKGGTHGDKGSHEKVIDRAVVYGTGVNPGRTSAAQVGKILPKIKRARVRADYYLSETITATESSEALQMAQIVMECCGDVAKKLQANVDQTHVVPAAAAVGRPPLIRLR